MEPWRIFMFSVSAAAFAWAFRADIAAGFYSVVAWWRSGRTSTVIIPPTGAKVTAEQAQAAVLTIARFLAQGKDDPAYKLIANDIKTLEQS